MSAGVSAGFDPAFYLAAYPDIAQIGYDPLQHYLRHGKQEGRAANQAEWDAKNGAKTNAERLASPQAQAYAQNPYAFDESFYRGAYPNLGLGTKADSAKQHYLQYGMQEGLSRNAFQAAGGYGESIDPAAGQFPSAPQAAAGLDPKDPASWAAYRKQAQAETQGLNRLPYMAPNSATLSADPLSVIKQFYPYGNNYGYVAPGQDTGAGAAGAASSSSATPVTPATVSAAASLGISADQLAQMVQQATGVSNLGMGINPLSGAGMRR